MVRDTLRYDSTCQPRGLFIRKLSYVIYYNISARNSFLEILVRAILWNRFLRIIICTQKTTMYIVYDVVSYSYGIFVDASIYIVSMANISALEERWTRG